MVEAIQEASDAISEVVACWAEGDLAGAAGAVRHASAININTLAPVLRWWASNKGTLR